MAENYAIAAVRHYCDAEILAASESYDGAGHLVGFAAECALKHGILSLRSELDSLRGHFPELIDLAKRHLNQRRHLGLYSVIKGANFMKDWSVDLRYFETGTINQEQFNLWRTQACSLLHAARLRK